MTGCLECSSLSKCTLCDGEKNYLLEDGECVKECKEGNYNSNSICENCDCPCKTCNGANNG